MDVEKLNRLEEEAQELLTIHALKIQATYTKDRVRIPQRCREGKGQWLKVLMNENLIRDMEK